MHQNAFIGLISLETLNLSGNALFFLPGEFAIHLKSLPNLHLYSDELLYVGNESLDTTTGLTTFILANNQFVEFNRSTFQPFQSSLTSIDKILMEQFSVQLQNEMVNRGIWSIIDNCPGGGGGTQIWFRRGCAAEADKPIPIFKGRFGGKGYLLLRVFSQENDVFVYFSDEMGENYKSGGYV